MSAARMSAAAPRPALAAITFDFGNTLVPVDRTSLEGVVGIAGRRGRAAVRRRPDGVPRGLGRGAGPPAPRGGAALPRGGPRDPPAARPRPAARDGAAGPRRRLGRRGGRRTLDGGRGRPRPATSTATRSSPASRPTRPSARCWLAWRPASGWGSCRTGRSLSRSTAMPRRPAGRRTWRRSSSPSESGRSSPTRRSSGRRSGRWPGPVLRPWRRPRSSTSATTGRRTSWAPRTPAGGRRTCGPARLTRRSPAASPTTARSPTSSWTGWPTSRRHWRRCRDRRADRPLDSIPWSRATGC